MDCCVIFIQKLFWSCPICSPSVNCGIMDTELGQVRPAVF